MLPSADKLHGDADFIFQQDLIVIIRYIYIALFCVLKVLYIEEGNLLNHHQCAASTWMMWWQPYCTRTPTTHQLTGGEETVMKPIGVWGLLIGHDGQRPMGKIGQGIHPYSFSKDILEFLMTTESQDLGLTSHPKDGAFYSIVSPSLHWGVRTHTRKFVFPGGFPSRYCLASVGNWSWAAGWYCCWLGTCPHCQRYQKLVQWPWCYCAWLASKLTWPEPHRESFMGYCQEEDETPDPTMQMTWRPLSKQPGLHYTWAVSQAECLHATPHWCSNSCKRGPTKYWVHRNEHTFQKPDISV